MKKFLVLIIFITLSISGGFYSTAANAAKKDMETKAIYLTKVVGLFEKVDNYSQFCRTNFEGLGLKKCLNPDNNILYDFPFMDSSRNMVRSTNIADIYKDYSTQAYAKTKHYSLNRSVTNITINSFLESTVNGNKRKNIHNITLQLKMKYKDSKWIAYEFNTISSKDTVIEL